MYRVDLSLELPNATNLSEAYETGMEILNFIRAWYDTEGTLESFYEIVSARVALPTPKETEQTWEQKWGEDAQYYRNEEEE